MKIPALVLLSAVAAVAGARLYEQVFTGDFAEKDNGFGTYVKNHEGISIILHLTFVPYVKGDPEAKPYPPYYWKGIPNVGVFYADGVRYFIKGVPKGKDWQKLVSWNAKTRKLDGVFTPKRNRSDPEVKTYDLVFDARAWRMMTQP